LEWNEPKLPLHVWISLIWHNSLFFNRKIFEQVFCATYIALK
jgi:hypothetical protein